METIADITPKDIMTFYYIEYYYRKNSVNSFDRDEMNTAMDRIMQHYIRGFGRLLYNQLKKYVQRGRYDEPFDIKETSIEPTVEELETYYKQMQTTYRSDMTRRNEKWIDIAAWTFELARAYRAGNYMGAFQYIDFLNNAIHNTNTKVIEKFANGDELLNALNIKFRSRHPSDYRYMVDRQILKLRLIECGNKPILATDNTMLHYFI